MTSVEKFEQITKFPLKDFLIESKNFFGSDFNDIVAFYSGNKNVLDRSHIKKLNTLSEKALYLQQIFRNRKNSLKSVEFWDLLDAVEDIKIKLNTSQNISKYLRSSIVKGTDKSGFVFDSVLGIDETLEDVNFNQLDETDEEKWYNIAIDNDLKEIDWDIAGGKKLSLRKNIFQSDLVTSMIDNTIGEKIYGRDIKKKFTYVDDDLEVLGYKETALQSVDILSKLSKGDIPENRTLGMDSMFYKGNNFSKMNFPSIVREMNKNFATDDLFTGFNVRDMNYSQGDLYIEFEVNTKYELVIVKNIKI